VRAVDTGGFPSKAAERAFVAASTPLFTRVTAPSTALSVETGNAYTASLYMSLAALVGGAASPPPAVGDRLLLFAFGSGAAASLYSLRVVAPPAGLLGGPPPRRGGGEGGGTPPAPAPAPAAAAALRRPRRVVDVHAYEAACARRAAAFGRLDWTPTGAVGDVAAGAWYLVRVEADGRRVYRQRGGGGAQGNGAAEDALVPNGAAVRNGAVAEGARAADAPDRGRAPGEPRRAARAPGAGRVLGT